MKCMYCEKDIILVENHAWYHVKSSMENSELYCIRPKDGRGCRNTGVPAADPHYCPAGKIRCKRFKLMANDFSGRHCEGMCDLGVSQQPVLGVDTACPRPQLIENMEDGPLLKSSPLGVSVIFPNGRDIYFTVDEWRTLKIAAFK